MSNFLLDAPRLTAEDLDKECDEADKEIIEEFENAWIEFLKKNPEKLVPRQEKRISKIKSQMTDTSVESKKIEEEFKLQLEFFAESRDQLEENFKRTMNEETENQKEMRDDLDRDVDGAAIADHNFSLTLPWEKFFYNLERVVAKESMLPLPKDIIAVDDITKPLLPSKRAVLLLKSGSEYKPINKDFMLQAYRVDEAMMKAQIKMYELEVERYEKTLKNLEDTGKFLTEHNIWGVLSQGDASTVASQPTAVTLVE